jgi:hypothetical protein
MMTRRIPAVCVAFVLLVSGAVGADGMRVFEADRVVSAVSQ